jgi:hypothetical protein
VLCEHHDLGGLLREPGARRPPLARLEELLDRADEPLATAEVALTMQTTIDAARDGLHARGRAGWA